VGVLNVPVNFVLAVAKGLLGITAVFASFGTMMPIRASTIAMIAVSVGKVAAWGRISSTAKFAPPLCLRPLLIFDRLVVLACQCPWRNHTNVLSESLTATALSVENICSLPLRQWCSCSVVTEYTKLVTMST
jgi:hypothetical protein